MPSRAGHGRTGPAGALEDGHGATRPVPGAGPRKRRSLRDVMTQLHGIHTLTTAA
ncbi:hypothetical protein AB0N06_22335 [Streptomyces sp. NPDC051020]|uniref:hypothetical protein n=1 Tax=Streptomyces sp. NPDC051020 TaxID=3155409 RepID=UPI0034253F69